MSQEWTRRLEGRLVAKLSVSSWSETTDEVMLFAHESGWTTLVVSHREDYDRDSGQSVGGQASVEATAYADVAVLERDVVRRWGTYEWWQLLDAAHDLDERLYAAWVPERMERDLDRSSLYPRDLSPGQDPVEAMAGRLAGDGWDVQPDQARLSSAAQKKDEDLFGGTRVLGVLVGRRHGWQAPIVVRVDDFGEVYARVGERGDVVGVELRELTAAERDQAAERTDRGWER